MRLREAEYTQIKLYSTMSKPSSPGGLESRSGLVKAKARPGVVQWVPRCAGVPFCKLTILA